MYVEVKKGQTIFDLALQYYGSVNAVATILEDNEIYLETSLPEGSKIVIRSTVEDQSIVDYFQGKKITSNG